ncbi:MAG: Gfo/Idh/MocA family oxidoreductase [Chloroflexi bacterium]|nr:Gfo/Idh/MocA family oxidoreductase [Chloroflexota bacterium]
MATVALLQRASARHRSYYLEAIRDLDTITAAAIVDPDGATFDEARRIVQNKPVRTYPSFDALREHEQPAMAIATFTGAEAPAMIRPVLDAGVPVLAEKPACVDAESFARLVDLSEQRRTPLMLALCNRLGPWAADVRRIVRDGGIGRLYAARALALADQTRIWHERTRDWSFRRAEAGGGHLIWLGIHWLDLLLFLTGERIVEVQAMAGNAGGGPIDVEDVAVVNFRFAGGAYGSLTSGYVLDSNKQLDLSLWGAHGWLRFDHTARTLDWHSPAAEMNQSPNRQFRYDSAGGGYTPFVRECLRASLREAPPPITAAEGLHVLRAIFGAYESARTGRTVTLHDRAEHS